MKKEKRINKKIIILISVIIMILAVVAAVNYIILPPKISENAIKYKYYGYNYMHLKSIIDDENNVIIEFGSINKYFNYFFNRNKIEASGDNLKFIRWIGNFDPYSNTESFPDYYIISTLTSNYLVISKSPEMKTKDLYSFNYDMDYQDVTIQLRFFEKYENAQIYMSKDYIKNNEIKKTEQKKQAYNSYDKKWNSIEKYTIYNGVTITTEE